ncbi:MAG TPA: MarR family transcriptional regulator [Beijerinckiaceae bacterium]|jgi:DNA-binding MarR family transcriptional regulator|nr:MarR family transcriptional regulator [Beijerinckiaceae bacterium]
MIKSEGEPAELAVATGLHRASLRLARQLRSTRAYGALSNSKLIVVGLLQRNGAMTGAALACELGIQPQSLTRLLAGLESGGLIRRDRDPADGRQALISLTTKGSETLAADMLERRRRLAEALGRVLTPAERDVLRVASGLMEKVVGALPPAGADRSATRDAAE